MPFLNWLQAFWLERNPTTPASSCPFCNCNTPTQPCWWAHVGMWGTSTEPSSWRWLGPPATNGTFQPPWEAGQPDYCGQPTGEKSCAGLWVLGNLTQPVQLGDLPCSCRMPYVCKTEPGVALSGGAGCSIVLCAFTPPQGACCIQGST